MSCYYPLRMHYLGVDLDGKDKYEFVKGRAQKSLIIDEARFASDLAYRKDMSGYHPKDVLIPCRRCIGCRLDYSRRWADRLMIELDHSKTALFFTLTYDDDHAHKAMFDYNFGHFWYTLDKKDVQDFNKRLREHFPDKYETKVNELGQEVNVSKIRFFAAGEYGDSTLRPHVHGIYFGLDLCDFPDAKPLCLNESHQQIYTSEKLKSIWKNGNVSIGRVSWQSCAYVARYNLKKLAAGKDNVCLSRNCIPEFALMSRRPGIAGFFPLDHPEIFENPCDKIYLSDPHGVRSVSEVNLPSYLFQKLELVNPDLYAIIKEERKKSSLDSFLMELSNTDLDEFEYLDLKSSLHESKSKVLKRALE